MRVVSLLLAAISLASAETRTWKSADGSRSFDADFVSQAGDSVTIRRTQDHKLLTIPQKSLHPDDIQWLAQHAPTSASASDDTAVFDNLHFGDPRELVEKKLRASKIVEMTLDETYIARVGLNGTFHTKKLIGGLSCSLFFDWTPAGKLSEVTLQTDPQPAAAYDQSLKATWQELANLITELHGKPAQSAAYPASAALKEGMFIPSHLWRLQPAGSALLGTSRDERGVQIVVRFTTRTVDPVHVP